ncbi:MAG: AraC family transcriptional regulator [Kiritimatiellae bacterium]|nr:AraC family transcriptional regulator [Kiritimatiellia bacterium]MDD5521176.1 AraC family transcriptional regulator [Kiritimatiellia bacterium]
MKLRAEQIQLLPGESFRFLQWSDNVSDVEVVAIDGTIHPFKGAGHEWHHHSQMELTLVTKGSGTRFVGDDITTFKAADLVMIGPNLPHYWHGLHQSSGYAIQFNFEPEHPFWQIPETLALRRLWQDAERGIHFTGDSAREVSKLIQSMPKQGGVGRFALFMLILQELSNVPPKNRELLSHKTFMPPSSQSTYKGIQKAIFLVFHHFNEGLHFTDVLKQADMSKATFERQFKKHTGKTFTQFVTEVRLDFASRQLIETDLSISEIAFASGFNNLSHFNHKFGELLKQTPRDFRKKMKWPLSDKS